MVRAFAFHAIVFSALVLCAEEGAQTLPHTERSKSEIAAEYLKSYEKIHAFYTNLSIDAQCRTTFGDDNAGTDIDLTLYLRDGELIRLDAKNINDDRVDKEATKTLLVTQKDWYSFAKENDVEPHRLSFKGDAVQGRFSVMQMVPFADFPFFSGGAALGKIRPDILDIPSSLLDTVLKKATVDSLDIEEKTEKGVRTVIFSHKGTSLPYKFTTLPALNWIISKTEVSSVEGGNDTPIRTAEDFDRMVGDFETYLKRPQSKTISEAAYEGEIDGVPLLKTLTISHYSPEGVLKSQGVYTITKITPGAPDMSVFDPKQFLPEKENYKLTPRKMSWQRKAAVVGGFALIALGFGIRYLMHENTRARPFEKEAFR